jgi:hypothetical protein
MNIDQGTDETRIEKMNKKQKTNSMFF